MHVHFWQPSGPVSPISALPSQFDRHSLVPKQSGFFGAGRFGTSHTGIHNLDAVIIEIRTYFFSQYTKKAFTCNRRNVLWNTVEKKQILIQNAIICTWSIASNHCVVLWRHKPSVLTVVFFHKNIYTCTCMNLAATKSSNPIRKKTIRSDKCYSLLFAMDQSF